MKTTKQYNVEEQRALGALRYWESRPEFMSEFPEGRVIRAMVRLIRTDNDSYQKFLNIYSLGGHCDLSKAKLPKRAGW